MKKLDDISEFENLFNKEMSTHSTPPPADAWANVAASTAGKSAGMLGQAGSFLGSATNLLKAALFAGGIAAVGIVVYNDNTSTETPEENIIVSDNKVKTPDTPELSNLEESVDSEKITTSTKEEKKIKLKNTPAKKSKLPQDSKPVETTKNNTAPSPEIVLQEEKPDNKSSSDKEVALTESASLPSFEISNPRPCLGDKITLSSSRKGTWYKNGEIIGTKIKNITTTLDKKGATLFLLEVGDHTISRTVDVQNAEAQIMSTVENSNYRFNLTDKSQIANWYVDNTLVVTNAKEYSTALTKVGDHTIKAIVTNSPCSKPTSITITTKPVGSIHFYDIMTLDGDGLNDEYVVEIKGYENYSIQIFDLENNLVFISTDPAKSWNGRRYNMGEECPSNSYVAKISYTLIGEAPTTKNIKLTLKRP
jgi:hypothetical protein